MFRPVFILVFFFLCGYDSLSAQVDDSKKLKTLEESVYENQKLFNEKPEVALYELEGLIKKAEQSGKDTLELKLLANRCEYYYFLRIDFEQLINSANQLHRKSTVYKNLLYQAKSHKYLAYAYSFNELYDKAIEELQSGLDVLDKANPRDSLIIMEKANFYSTFANIYGQKKEYFNSLRSLFNSYEEHDKLTNPELRRGTKFMDYSSLGAAYMNVDLDSAEYFINKSISLSTEKEANHNITFLNYIVLGNIYLERENYKEALRYYKKAETIEDGKFHINREELYTKLAETYGKLNQPELKEKYESKLKDLQLKVAQNRNKSLQKIIQQREDSEINTNNTVPESKHTVFWILGGIILSAIVFFTFRYLKGKEKESFTEEKENFSKTHSLTPEVYENLIALLRKCDPKFILYFEKEFPEFRPWLMNINPNLSETEMELLAMLKIGLATKEIADYKNISYRTVQNMRYRVRKKLHLPTEIELEEWVREKN